MPAGNGEAMVNTSSNNNSEGKLIYVGTCPGLLRMFIAGLGLGCIILASIGSPNDYGDDGYDVQSVFDSDVIGYGLGYGPAEPLNGAFIGFLVIAWVITLGFVGVKLAMKSDTKSTRINRLLYLSAGIIAWLAIICGSIGTYLFWEGCCHVSIPSGGKSWLTYHVERDQGYLEWCLCYLRISDGRDEYKYARSFRYSPEMFAGSEIVSAWPHHFVTHLISLVFSAVFGVLCFVAVCYP